MRTLSCVKDASLTPLRILLVDDHDMGLAARRTILQEQGYQVTTATEGFEALARFESGTFDLVITDYKMPNMDGLKLIESIRKTNLIIPIILISGYADALGMDESSTGADSVIAKNAQEIQHLVRAVKRLLKQPPKKPVQTQRAHARARRQSV